jgi:hypothetical protein
MLLVLCQYIGATLGVLGALLVASKTRKHRFIAFNLWIFSNISLIVYYINLQAWGLIGMGSFYTATAVLGWWNNRKD